jgi:hypothetical protein
VKGATALLARELGVRGTIDIDLYRDASVAVAERELREAAATDLGDWFAFELGAAQAVSDGAGGVRIPIEALIGPTVWASFHVDLVGAEVTMTGEPDEVPALARIDMPGVAIATGASVDAAAQMRALTSEAERRDVDLPGTFEVPDRAAWERGYGAEAGRSLLDIAQSLDEALAIVGPFLDPLLGGNAHGRWGPEVGAWA